MKKRYVYNVSFFHSTGQGAARVAYNHKIKSIEDFNDVKELIEEEKKVKNVAIINFQLIGKQRIKGH